MTLWGGRFKDGLDAKAWRLNTSIGVDYRMGEQDVRGSQAWARQLVQVGVLKREEHVTIAEGLNQILQEIQKAEFSCHASDEDIHSAVERRLEELVGPVAGKLHTGRSRNDQVATDFRLWLLDHLPALDEALATFQATLVQRAEQDLDFIMPGYTHTQRAQPVLLAHWWMSHFWALERDRQRLAGCTQRTATSPLGAGALAGSTFAVDRHALAIELGFEAPAPNSIDAVADRDFAAEFLFCAALIGIHLSRLSESMILFTTPEFGFFELADAFATGSSLMPQKKNPDLFELARGKTGNLICALISLLTTLKGLPSAYDKDLQEDKLPVFTAFDTLMASLPVLGKAIMTLKVNPVRLRAGLDDFMLATDLADYLVEQGVPFRKAHYQVGEVVRHAIEQGVTLRQLPLETYKEANPAFDERLYERLDPHQSLLWRKVFGGTDPEAVHEQLELVKLTLQQNHTGV